VSRLAILLNGDGTFRPAYTLGYREPPGYTLHEQSLTLRRLGQKQHALVEYDDATSWVQLTGGQERTMLEELKPELLLPLSSNDKVLGIMSLGPKRSEEPFSPIDLRLLNSMAVQTGLALENGRLTEAIKEEAREKQVRELELGREVQERLFPQELRDQGARLCGCVPAGARRRRRLLRFLPLKNGGLGIAIGDVSGKGFSAVLLMATLRAFLRSQAIEGETDLSSVIANLNRRVFESSALNRYATFFLATYDSASGVLRYVNAGTLRRRWFAPETTSCGWRLAGLLLGCCAKVHGSRDR
jgi:sigma-B regulation protein RsbU (phosphoserine phosphatase)